MGDTASRQVWVLTQRVYPEDIVILDIFESKTAAESRILGWIRAGKMEKLNGLNLFSKTVMIS